MRVWIACWFRAALMVLAASGGAGAQCIGGNLLKGGYGVVLYGVTAGGGSEALAGSLQGDGHCGLTAMLSGNIAGTPLQQVAASGTYYVNPNLTGGLSLSVGGAAPMIFAVNWILRHRQVTGLESDGGGFAQIDAKLQEPTNFGQQTLKGSFGYLCYTPANEPLLMFSGLFDGAGNVTASGSQFQGAALAPWGPEQGTYLVNPDGSYTLTLAGPNGDSHVFGGTIDSATYDAPAAEITENGSGGIMGPAHCIGQKQ